MSEDKALSLNSAQIYNNDNDKKLYLHDEEIYKSHIRLYSQERLSVV